MCVCISRVQLKFQRALSKAPIEVAACACVYLIISSNGLVCLFSNVNNNWGYGTHVQYLNIYPGRCETHWWGANTDSNWPRRASYGWRDFRAAARSSSRRCYFASQIALRASRRRGADSLCSRDPCFPLLHPWTGSKFIPWNHAQTVVSLTHYAAAPK